MRRVSIPCPSSSNNGNYWKHGATDPGSMPSRGGNFYISPHSETFYLFEIIFKNKPKMDEVLYKLGHISLITIFKVICVMCDIRL